MARYEYERREPDQELTLSGIIGWYGDKVDSALARLLKSNTKLGHAAAEAVLNGGKRVRPVLALLACEAVSGSFEQAMPIAMAYELAHCASLTQDDIIDESDIRRGSPTIHSKYGVGTAMLVSDVLLFKMFDVLGSYGDIAISKRRLTAILAQLGSAARKAAEGEFLEATLASERHPTESDYLKAAGLKTGALLAASAASGAIAGKASQSRVNELYGYGYELGISFQIVDDVLDIAGSTIETGKPVFKDLQNGAANIVLAHALENASPLKRNVITSMIWKKSYGLSDVQSLGAILEETGSLQYARELSERHSAIAREHLGELEESEAKKRLRDLTHVLGLRKQ